MITIREIRKTEKVLQSSMCLVADSSPSTRNHSWQHKTLKLRHVIACLTLQYGWSTARLKMGSIYNPRKCNAFFTYRRLKQLHTHSSVCSARQLQNRPIHKIIFVRLSGTPWLHIPCQDTVLHCSWRPDVRVQVPILKTQQVLYSRYVNISTDSTNFMPEMSHLELTS